MKSYKQYLRAIGRKPIPDISRLRTVKQPGDVEIVYRDGNWVRHVHEERV